MGRSAAAWWTEPPVDPGVKALAKRVLTLRQYDAWRMNLAGYGARRIGIMLGCSPTSAYDHVARAKQQLFF